MQTNANPTISGSGIHSILAAFELMGLDIQSIKSLAGLNSYDLADPQLRLPCLYASHCYDIAQTLWQGEHFGLVHGHQYQPLSLGILGHLLATAETCQDAFKSYERYQRVFGEGLIFESVPHTPQSKDKDNDKDYYIAELNIHPKLVDAIDKVVIDSFFVALMNCIRLLTGSEQAFAYVELQREAPHDQDIYRETYNCPVHFSQARNRVFLPAEIMDKRLVSANPSLYETLESKIILSGDCSNEEALFIKQVHLGVLKCLDGQKITVDRIANQLSMSSRTLQRKLSKSAVTFQDILNEVRMEFALREIRENIINIEETAYLLGYSEPGTFRKAFKQWTGKTPKEYRDTLS